MPDFFHNRVATFPILPDGGIERMRDEIMEAVTENRMRVGIIIPALYTDLISPAMAGIIEHLKDIEFIERIYISLDRATKTDYQNAKEVVKPLGDKCRLLWNDSPKVIEILNEVQERLPLGNRGKGRAVWLALGYALAKQEVAVIACHDADIITYDKELLTRLLFPIMRSRYQFSKGYYARYSDKLNGRVVRLFYFPFLRALKQVVGYTQFLEYMSDFRYPLSGEFAIFASQALEMRFPSDWGIEVGVLGEIYRLVRVSRICQIEITQRYDHKHQEVGGGKTNDGLMKMAADIARTLFMQIASEGTTLSRETFISIRLTYLRFAKEIAEMYETYASMHKDLVYDIHEETSNIEKFASAIDRAVEEFYKNPYGSPLIPDWKRVEAAIDNVFDRLVDALDE